MAFDIHLNVDTQSPEGITLESIITRERVSSEEAVRNLLKDFGHATPDNYDHIFTPEVIATLDAARIEARTGNNLTMESVRQNLKIRRKAWQKDHPPSPHHYLARSVRYQSRLGLQLRAVWPRLCRCL
jgi:hypothetical protein